MPQGTICSGTCEASFMEKLVKPWHRHKHRFRAQWMKHLGIKTMSNIGKTPKCGEHFTYTLCLTDSLDKTALSTWLDDPRNTLKQREKRAKKKNTPPLPDCFLTEIHKMAGGAICAGKQCFTSLWLFKGESEYESVGLQYCSLHCMKTRKRHKNFNDYHRDRIHIIQTSFAEKYFLVTTDLDKECTLGGATLLEQLNNAALSQ